MLTFTTLLLLTFTVLSFTSIRTGLRVSIKSAATTRVSTRGILIRSKAWNPMEDSVLEYARSNFGDRAAVAPRSWYQQ